MKILVISPGKVHDRVVKDGIEEYQKRLSKKFDVEWVFPSIGNKESESVTILKSLKDTDFVVLLDEKGKDVDTLAFAKLLDKQMQSTAKRLVFIIGGAFGVGGDVIARANMTLKLSSLVFPHMLARLILMEQLYRATSILSGGKYHHA